MVEVVGIAVVLLALGLWLITRQSASTQEGPIPLVPASARHEAVQPPPVEYDYGPWTEAARRETEEDAERRSRTVTVSEFADGGVGGKISDGDNYMPMPDDAQFTRLMERTFGSRLRSGYYTTLAGVSHSNADGSSRRKAIRKCEPCDPLVLHTEPRNSYDPHAIAVLTQDGRQIGYLHRSEAAKLASGIDRGEIWLAVFRRQTCLLEPRKKLLGAVILLVQLAPRPSDRVVEEVAEVYQ